MANGTSVVSKGPLRAQWQGLYSHVFPFSCTMDVGSLADGAGETNTVAVPGVALGDLVEVAGNISIASATVTAWVSATDVVSIRFQNESGAGPLDLASMTIKGIAKRPNWV